ncbi:hypothetical protein BsWGS_26589 [Bradybaena similaris]
MVTPSWLLHLLLLAVSRAECHPLISHGEPAKESTNPVFNRNGVVQLYNNENKNNRSLPLLHKADLHIRSLLFSGKTRSDMNWSHPSDDENRTKAPTRLSQNFDGPVRVTKDKPVSKRDTEHGKRVRRATSKFTGLVVGASRDNKLLQTVTQTLSAVEAFIWSLQSQFSKPFSAAKHEPAVILGTFSSDFRTNFHGGKSEASLRRGSNSLQDVNSLTTLYVLQCLVEASLYGSGTTPAAANVSIAVESLKNFYTNTYSTGSSIVAMWPEKLLADKSVWVSRPENIIGGQVKDNTTFKQLEHLAKTCNCEPAKSGLQKLSEDKLCKDHFSEPVSTLFGDTANPPDFLTSFSNLALGSILQFTSPGKKSGLYKTESELWHSANSDVQILINKLKSTVIVFPAKAEETHVNNSVNTQSNSTSPTGKKVKRATKEEAIKSNTTFENTTVTSEDGNSSLLLTGEKHVEAENITNTNAREYDDDFFVQSTQGLESNESLEPTIAEESINSSEEVSTNTTTDVQPPQRADTSTEDAESNQTTSNNSTTPVALNNSTHATPTPSPVATTTSAKVVASTTTVPLAERTTLKPVSEKAEEKVRVNQILSSECYYALRNYLDAVLPEGKEDVILIPSLITDDSISAGKNKGVAKNDGNVWHNGKLLHSYNKVDLTTTATVLHGIVVSSLSGVVKIQDDVLLQDIVVSSLRLLTWFLSNPQEVVAMVTLSVFPSRYQMYYVAARVAFHLNSKQAHSSKMFQFADGVIPPFVKALRDKMTFSILQSIIDGGLGQDGKTRVYVDDFLGVVDVDDKGHKLSSGDDRLFTSAMAINILIATWTVQNEHGGLEFIKGTGDPVHIAINSLANYIFGVVTDPALPNLNAFMSEEIKNCETSPARYPANIITSPDGTELKPTQPELSQRFGVKGYISKQDYQNLLTKPSFGYTTRGGSLDDLNGPTSIFRFWSSVAYTKSVALLAIAQAANLQFD